MHLIWLSTVLMIAVAVILVFLVPQIGFLGGVGVFLIGIGLISLFLLMFMGKRESPIFPAFVAIAGAVLIANILLPMANIMIPWYIVLAIAAVLVVAGLILWIVLKK